MFSFIILLFIKKDDNTEYKYTAKYFFIPSVISGITLAIGNLTLLVLCSVMPAIVVYPSNQGGSALLTAVVSVVLFKEKLKPKTVISLILGLGAITLLNIK